jgi:Flp pilus assembly protein TadB
MDEIQRALGRIEGKLDAQEKAVAQRFDAIEERLDGLHQSKVVAHSRMDGRIDNAEQALSDHEKDTSEAHGMGAVGRSWERLATWGALVIAFAGFAHSLMSRGDESDRPSEAQEVPGRAAGQAVPPRR